LQDFLDSLKGADGADGADGAQGIPGQNGTNGQDGVDGSSVPTANLYDKSTILGSGQAVFPDPDFQLGQWGLTQFSSMPATVISPAWDTSGSGGWSETILSGSATTVWNGGANGYTNGTDASTSSKTTIGVNVTAGNTYRVNYSVNSPQAGFKILIDGTEYAITRFSDGVNYTAISTGVVEMGVVVKENANSGGFNSLNVKETPAGSSSIDRSSGDGAVFTATGGAYAEARIALNGLTVGATYTVGAQFDNGFSNMTLSVDGIGELNFTNAQFVATSTSHLLRLRQNADPTPHKVHDVALHYDGVPTTVYHPFIRVQNGGGDYEVDFTTPYTVIGEVVISNQ
jgi:hypothetical protein